MVQININKWEKKHKFFNKGNLKQFREKTSSYTMFMIMEDFTQCRVEDNTYKGAALNYLIMDGATVKVMMSVYDPHRQGVAYDYRYTSKKFTSEQIKCLFNMSSRRTSFWKALVSLIRKKDTIGIKKFIDFVAISQRLFLE